MIVLQNSRDQPSIAREMGHWTVTTYFRAMQRDLKALLDPSKQVVLDEVAITVLQELHDQGLESLARELPAAFPWAYVELEEVIELNELKYSIQLILEAQNALRSLQRSQLHFPDPFTLQRSAKSAAVAFYSLLENWVSLEKWCKQSIDSNDEVEFLEILLHQVRSIRLSLREAAENNSWRQIRARTLLRLFERGICGFQKIRRHTLNSVYLPLLI